MSRPSAAILDAAGLRLTPDEAAFFRDADPFGFILFARNIDTADQVRALVGEMRAAVGRNAPVLIDQEGGRVQRIRPPLARDWPPPLEMAPMGARAMYLRGALIGSELAALGIDVNCIPTLDVAREATHSFLRNRCLGTDAATVTALGRALAQGSLAAGVLPVMKHMPGHGLGRVDSHKDLPVIDASAEDLRATDFAPFRALAAEVPMGMTGHMVVAAFDADRPATHSPTIIRLIRDEIGFDGLLMSDDLSMEALGGSPAERTRAALNAGCDLALYCNRDLPTRIAIAEAAGEMSEAAFARAETALAQRRAATLDTAALQAEFEALSAEVEHW